MERAVVTVSVLLVVVGSISIRPEIEEDLSIPPSQDTEIGEYTGGKDGRGLSIKTMYDKQMYT